MTRKDTSTVPRHGMTLSEETRPHPSSAEMKMSGKAILSSKRIDFDYFDREGFSIVEWIRTVGSESFCSMVEKYYPHLIREFYGSLAHRDNGWIAEVKGIQIPMNAEKISRAWEIPAHGRAANCMGNRTARFRCILERDDV